VLKYATANDNEHFVHVKIAKYVVNLLKHFIRTNGMNISNVSLGNVFVLVNYGSVSGPAVD